MFIEKHGNGKNIYAGFHGWSGDHHTFDTLVSFLPPDSTFFSYDLPGCGNSPEPESWNSEHLTSMLLNSLQKIALNPITLIGNCSGAILGLMVAKKNHQLFSRLVLVDPFAYMPWYFSIFLNKYIGKHAYSLTFTNSVGRWITNVSLKAKRTEHSNLTKSFEKVNHTSVYQYLKILGEVEGAFQFKGLSMPIDILYGERTFNAVKNSIKIWKNVFPQANTYELKGAGHLPLEESAIHVAKILFKSQ